MVAYKWTKNFVGTSFSSWSMIVQLANKEKHGQSFENKQGAPQDRSEKQFEETTGGEGKTPVIIFSSKRGAEVREKEAEDSDAAALQLVLERGQLEYEEQNRELEVSIDELEAKPKDLRQSRDLMLQDTEQECSVFNKRHVVNMPAIVRSEAASPVAKLVPRPRREFHRSPGGKIYEYVEKEMRQGLFFSVLRQELRHEENEKENTIQQLSEEVYHLRSKMEVLARDEVLAKNYLQDLRQNMLNHNMLKDNLENESSIKELKAEIDKLKQQLALSVKECDLVRQEKEDCIEQSKNFQAELSSCLEAMLAKQKQCEIELIREAKSYENLFIDIEKITADRDVLRMSLQETETRCAKLQQDKIEKESTIRQLSAEVDRLRCEIEALVRDEGPSKEVNLNWETSASSRTSSTRSPTRLASSSATTRMAISPPVSIFRPLCACNSKFGDYSSETTEVSDADLSSDESYGQLVLDGLAESHLQESGKKMDQRIHESQNHRLQMSSQDRCEKQFQEATGGEGKTPALIFSSMKGSEVRANEAEDAAALQRVLELEHICDESYDQLVLDGLAKSHLRETCQNMDQPKQQLASGVIECDLVRLDKGDCMRIQLKMWKMHEQGSREGEGKLMRWSCDWKCGFISPCFDEVAQHERTCPRSHEKTFSVCQWQPDAMNPDETLTPNSIV